MSEYSAISDRVANAIGDKNTRVVVVAGAGASADAGIPTGREVGARLLESDQRILRHELGGEPETWSFFDLVDVLAKFRGEEGVQHRLQTLLAPRFISLGYEILAHYLHRNEINAVVSVNHDQALDDSLELESPRLLWQARSRSEFDALLEHIQTTEELPTAYLKIHGCVSRKMTFRIDRGSVARLEKEKLGVLEHYFGKADLILCIGWSMHDPDVFRPLAEVLGAQDGPGRRQLVVVDANPSVAFNALVTELGGETCKSTAAEFLKEVGEKVESKRKAGVRPRAVGLHRHLIRAKCFGESGCLQFEPESQAALEVVMFALKARAQIEPRILFECDRTSQLLAKAGKDVSKQLPTETAQVRSLARILRRLCDAGILTCEDGELGSVYWFTSPEEPFANSAKPLEQIVRRVVAKLPSLYPRTDGEYPFDWELVGHLTALTTAFDVDLIPRASDFAMFTAPELILSKEQFDALTSRLLGQGGPEDLLCVSTNTGEWIQDHETNLSSRPIGCCQILIEDYDAISRRNPFKIIAPGRLKEAMAALDRKNIKTEVKVASNKSHQLTAIMEADGHCKGAIYFRREGKSTRISPVWLTDARDLELVGRIWRHLWSGGRTIRPIVQN